jgi:hypothetical protein
MCNKDSFSILNYIIFGIGKSRLAMGQGNKIARLEKNDTPDNQGFLERLSSGPISQNQEISGLLSRSNFKIAMLTLKAGVSPIFSEDVQSSS